MKIAFLNKYQNKVYRGAETFVSELSKRLSKNHDVDVISDINYLKIIKNKYDFIIPTNGRFQVVIIKLISLFTRSKVIVSGQSGIGWDDKVNLLVTPDVFIALTDKAYKWAKKFNPFVKVEKIPNGVDLEKFGRKGNMFKTGLKKPIVLTVGAFSKQKRLDLVIKAVSKLEDVSLLIAGGGGELKKEIEDQGKRLLGKRFRVISLPFEKMPEVYRSADLFTLPSLSSESFGNVYVEAMASGLGVVAPDDEQRHEIVGDSGLFVDPTDIDSYADKIKEGLEISWGDRPRKQAGKFSWDVIAKQYESLFKKLIKKE